MPVFGESLIRAYSRMGDVGVIAICCTVFVLLTFSYINRTKSYRIFNAIVGFIMLAAIVNVGYHELLRVYPSEYKYAIYVMRCLYNTLLFLVFFLFTLYATVITDMVHKQARIVAITSMTIFLVLMAVDILFTVLGLGFYIDANGNAYRGSYDIFLLGYYLYVLFLAILVFKIRRRIFKRVAYSFICTMLLSVITRTAQLFVNDASLTTFTFTLPVITMLYTMHSNPYNIATGTLDRHAMRDLVKNLYAKDKDFIIMSLTLPDYVGEGKSLPEVVKEQTRRFTVDYFRDGTLFQINNGQIIMIARKDKNPDYEEWMQTILKAFMQQYQIHKMPFKIVYGESLKDQIKYNEWAAFLLSINSDIPENVMHRIKDTDVRRFKDEQYIIDQLEDIYKNCDLNDPRVLVYAQPVFNISTKRFDTAEALMRLRLERTGTISPGLFIPLAEERGYIHALTKIILNKTCQMVHKFREQGLSFKRISVNVSMIELKSVRFCDDVINILKENDVDGESIAIELTESQSEADFMLMKEKIEILHEQGIKFYLDDFGTGYSNMERIFELPFDIIKFDRSMVIASGEDKRSERIVENLAKMFKDFDYRILYEGIENNADEERCLGMSANYLQGFKYSRPIPIEELEEFISRPN